MIVFLISILDSNFIIFFDFFFNFLNKIKFYINIIHFIHSSNVFRYSNIQFSYF